MGIRAPGEVPGTGRRAGKAIIVATQLVAVGLVVGWFAAGHPSAPDGGLSQLDLLSLHERVAGVTAVGGRPTMVVVTCPTGVRRVRLLSSSYSLVVSTDPALADRLALPRAKGCQAGYVLVDDEGFVRYRSYDPGWQRHPEEQEILLEHLDGQRR